MRRTNVSYGSRLVALAMGALLLTWGLGAGVSDAQHHDDHGGHDDHGSSTTQVTTPTTGQTTTSGPPAPGVQRKTVRYGPYTIQPAPPPTPTEPHGHAHTGSAQIGAEKPCNDCYITRMVPDLVRADGTRAGHGNRLQLHHMVLFNRQQGRTDATCGGGGGLLGLAGQRFFASGDERTPTEFPNGYGYRLTPDSMWILLWDLASTSTVAETVYYTVTFDYVPATTPMRDVEPVWMDVDQCGDSEVSVPAGPSTVRWTWNVNRPGDIVSIGGHLHDGGRHLEIRNDSTNQLICDSVATYGETPLFVDHHGVTHVSSMTGCLGNPVVANVTSGQRVTITGHYDAPAPMEDAMAISVAYIGQPGGGTPGPGNPQCHRDLNSAHVSAGRAQAWLIFAWARGSNQYLGLTFATTSLREGPAGTWTLVTSC